MNNLTLLFAVMCVVVASARHIEDKDDLTRHPERSATRHRRRRWDNRGYNYNSPPSYYNDRRDYDRPNQDVILHIFRLLEDIAVQLKAQRLPPPPQPQPIYIPYPVPYPASATPCTTTHRDSYPSYYNPVPSLPKPNITSRFPAMEDTNQNWGFVVPEESDDDSSDGSRPISFDPIVPKQQMRVPPPAVEHGSVQESQMSLLADRESQYTSMPVTPIPKTAGMCNAAILSCCGFTPDKQQQKQCFTSIGCAMAYDNGNPCSAASVQQALDSFKLAYSPV